jgi:acetylornithine/succinyldiaminopimelate/putrescine aminotransferase
VVVSRTKIDTFYFEEGEVHFFRSGDSEAMAEAMLEVINNQKLRESLIARGYEYVERNGWDRKKKEYLDLIDSLSTECFDDIEPALSAALQCQRRRNRQASTAATDGQVGRLAVKLSDPASVSSCEGKLAQQQRQ